MDTNYTQSHESILHIKYVYILSMYTYYVCIHIKYVYILSMYTY